MTVNIITAPRFWKNKAVLIKPETAYGTDAIPTGAANWIEARNISFNPYNAETKDRSIEMPWMGSSGKTVVATWGQLSFDFLVAGSGTVGTAPKWAPILMGCGFAETISAGVSAAYNLVSAAMSSLSVYVNIDGVYHQFIGARGDLKAKINAKDVPLFSTTLDCLYVGPVATAMPAVTRTGWQIDEGANHVNTTALTLNGIPLAVSTHDWGLGNQVSKIDLPGPQLEVAITDRKPTMNLEVLAPPLATFDPFALATAGTNVTATITHGSVAGRQVKFDYKVVLINVAYSQIDAEVGYKLTLEPTPVSGNDEITITVQ